MFGSKFFNEITGSQNLETKLTKEAKKEKEINVNIEDLDKPIVFEIKNK
jgi:hypothetical protein